MRQCQPPLRDGGRERSILQAQRRRFPSPLRYPGGKGKVANFIKLLLLKNNLVGHRYAEVYAGGASVALSLLYEEYASHIHINDLNRSVFAFWDAVLNHSDTLCQRIRDTPVTIEEWAAQKVLQEIANPDPIDLAFSTFFLNRTNQSGIVWSGGAIGGRSQKGKWKLDARFNKAELIRRIEKAARYQNRITLTQKDAADYIREDLCQLPHNTFVYFDPPYFVKGNGLYQHSYQLEHHTEIAQLVGGVRHPWLVSYDAAPEILDLYGQFRQITYQLRYSANECYEGGEAMFFSPGLSPPEVPSPAKIPSSVVDSTRMKYWLNP